jgi:hypothetical protein
MLVNLLHSYWQGSFDVTMLQLRLVTFIHNDHSALTEQRTSHAQQLTLTLRKVLATIAYWAVQTLKWIYWL